MSGWDNHSKTYDQHFDPVLALYSIDLLRLFNSSLFSSPSKITVLDVCCGSGAMTFEMAKYMQEKGQKALVIPSDFSVGMLELLQAKIPLYSFESVEIGKPVRDNANTLKEFPDSSCDIITSAFGIALLPNIRRSKCDGWFAAFRVLKPGGYLLASGWKKDCEYLLFLDFIQKARNQPSKIPENPHFTSEGFTKLVQYAGFQNVHIDQSTHYFKWDQGKVFLDALIDNPFFIKLVTEMGIERISQVAASFWKKNVESFLNDPLQFEATALLCIAQKE